MKIIDREAVGEVLARIYDSEINCRCAAALTIKPSKPKKKSRPKKAK